jgi:hypothetical protein
MAEITLQQSEDFLIHASVNAVQAIPGNHHLLIQSQWLGASIPEGLQTRLSLVGRTEHLRAIANLILEQTA